jgi:hypothetical protein
LRLGARDSHPKYRSICECGGSPESLLGEMGWRLLLLSLFWRQLMKRQVWGLALGLPVKQPAW